jgi:hypothetical protein
MKENLDQYYIRTSIFNALKEAPQFKGDLLDIGCGVRCLVKKYILENSTTSYIGLDIECLRI